MYSKLNSIQLVFIQCKIFYVNKSVLRDLRVLGIRPLKMLEVGGCFCFPTNVTLRIFCVVLFVGLSLEQWPDASTYPTQYSEMRNKYSVAENRWASYCKRGPEQWPTLKNQITTACA